MQCAMNGADANVVLANIGYALVSTGDQDNTIQIEKLRAAGCTKVFAEKVSGKIQSK